MRRSAVLAAAALVLLSGSAPAQNLPWEVTVAEIEAGRVRHLAQRLSKQNLLYQLHLGDERKDDLVATASQIDRILISLEKGSPAYSIPEPWTRALREQVRSVDDAWGPLRRLAIANPYEYIHLTRQFAPPDNRRGDPLLIRFFDDLSQNLIDESEKLLALYHEECVATGLQICATARTSGYAAMLMERATQEAVYVVAGIDANVNRKRLAKTVSAYLEVRRQNDESAFFAAALDPERGPSAVGAGQLLISLRNDWDEMQAQITILSAGDEQNFDLRPLLAIQIRLVAKVERLSAALVRYASLTYGS
jgi:hypothetical protein